MTTGIQAIEIVKHNLNKKIREIEGACTAGLIEAAVAVRSRMEAEIPYIPLDLGNLRASWFVVTKRAEKTPPPDWEEGPSKRYGKANIAKLAADHKEAVEMGKKDAHKFRGPAIAMGFSASYALAVHEMPADRNWSKVGSGPKFFQSHFYRSHYEIVQTIRNSARKPVNK